MADRFVSWWRNLARDGLPPNSPAAYVFALACVSAAVLVRVLFGLTSDAVLPYATYYPAILLATLAGGTGPGIFAMLVSLAVVLWAFSTPVVTHAVNIVLFLLSSGATICVVALYRGAARRLIDEEKKRALLVRELEHRGKNTFAIVQSIVRQSLQDQKDVADIIVGRIRSVSATNDIITKSSNQTAALRAILERELSPYGRARITLDGAHVQLNAELARSFSLIVHELATNAAKYGALCKPDGELRVEWTLRDERLWLRWSEKNGPSIDKPFQPGFGARLVTRLLRNHGGEVTPEFNADGLSVQIALVLPADTAPLQHGRPVAHQPSHLL
jgi:two-component sensor histidine kinase